MSDVRFEVRRLIGEGWAVVPIPRNSKKATRSWNTEDYDESHFKADSNVAVKCGAKSQDRVDIDCDCQEAIIAARLLLPQTDLAHGRLSKPDSHYWYTCPGAKTEAFTDVGVEVDDPKHPGKKRHEYEMLVELRSTGGYTVVPPSVHSSGELIEWTRQKAPLEIKPEELRKAVLAVATAALVARHWPGPGARHGVAGPLAGFLHSTKTFSNMMILEIIKTICVIAKDPDPTDRLNYAKGTLEKAEAGEAVTGGPKLGECIGDDVVGKLRTYFKVKDEDSLGRFNEKHFIVTMGKDAVIGREDMPGGVVFQQRKALDLEYANEFVYVMGPKGSVQKPIFEEWLRWKHRRSYRRVVFTPPPGVPEEDDYNLWQGFAVTPDPSKSCDLFLAHVREVICSGDADHYAYMLNLLALTVQEPGTPTGVAVVLRGGQGAGKGVFVRTLGDLFGRKHYTQLDKVEQLAGKFNASLSGKLIVFADEAFFAGDKREIGALKRLITEPTLHIERKGIDGTDEDNHVHLFMATNEHWSWPADLDDRRGFLLEVSKARMNDTEYWNALYHEIENGGRAGLLAYLLSIPADRSLLREVPKTRERLNQQIQSLDPMLMWWYDCLFGGIIGGHGWPDKLHTTTLLESYKQSTHAARRMPTLKVFSTRLKKFFSDREPTAIRISKQQLAGYHLRPLADARAYWDSITGIPEDWPEDAATSTKIPF